MQNYLTCLAIGEMSVDGDRKDESVLCRVGTGQTHLTHPYTVKRGPSPQCQHWSHTFNPSIHCEERSFTSMSALAMHSVSLDHFGPGHSFS